MKKNKFKIIIALFLGTINFHMINAAQQPYEDLRVYSSNASFASIGYYVASTIPSMLNDVSQLISLTSIIRSQQGNRSVEANEQIFPSSKAALRNIAIKSLNLTIMCNVVACGLGFTKQTDSALMYGFLAGATKAIYSRLTTPAEVEER